MNAETPAQKIIDSIYTEYRDNIYFYILTCVRDKYEAEDLTQDVFLRLMRKGILTDSGSIGSFLYVVARNIVSDYFRSLSSRKKYDRLVLHTANMCAIESESAVNVINLLEHESKQMDKMSPACKQVYYLYRFKEMNCHEIAKAMDIDLHSVNNFLYTSRRKMRAYLKSVYK
jgi:RNA polymerase sigma factor (sigma-70 family)